MSYGFIPDGVTVGQRVGDTFNHPRDGSGFAGATDINDANAMWIVYLATYQTRTQEAIGSNSSAVFSGSTHTHSVRDIADYSSGEPPFWQSGNTHETVRHQIGSAVYRFTLIDPATSDRTISPSAGDITNTADANAGFNHWKLALDFQIVNFDEPMAGYYKVAADAQIPMFISVDFGATLALYTLLETTVAADYGVNPTAGSTAFRLMV